MHHFSDRWPARWLWGVLFLGAKNVGRTPANGGYWSRVIIRGFVSWFRGSEAAGGTFLIPQLGQPGPQNQPASREVGVS